MYTNAAVPPQGLLPVMDHEMSGSWGLGVGSDLHAHQIIG